MGASFVPTFLRKRPPRRYLAISRFAVLRPIPTCGLGWDLARKVKQDRRRPAARAVHCAAGLPRAGGRERTRRQLSRASRILSRGPGPASFALTVGRTVRSAAKILTCSEFSRRSILKVYGDIDEDKVVVAPNAAASIFRPISREAATAHVRDRLKIAEPFVLSVGDLQPRKNQIGLIKAFARMVRAYPQFNTSASSGWAKRHGSRTACMKPRANRA